MACGKNKETHSVSAKQGGSKAGPSNTYKGLPHVYHEMLADAVSSTPATLGVEGRPVKRRRIGGRLYVQDSDASVGPTSDIGSVAISTTDGEGDTVSTALRRQQTAYNDSEDSADSDMDWEEVVLKDGIKAIDTASGSETEDKKLDIVLGNDSSGIHKKTQRRGKFTSAADRRLRLEIHKMHVLSLLVHLHLRNHWCNDKEIQRMLRNNVPKRTLSYLDPEKAQSQFQRSRSFMDGLNQASELFRGSYKITSRGLSRSFWAESPEGISEVKIPEDIDLPMEKADFQEVAEKFKGSRDTGAQIYCALLRSTGVEARLVSSLQALPFTATAKRMTPQKPKPAYTFADAESRAAYSGEASGADVSSDTTAQTTASVDSTNNSQLIKSRLAARLGRPLPSSNTVPSTASKSNQKKSRLKKIRESPCPVYWVEAFNAAIQKWVPVDPLITNTIAKPSRFEPPASDLENNMTYVIAFEGDGSARDVTRRYAKAYNAKTRRGRVEATKGGERWWRRVMRLYRRSYALDREQVEDAELNAKEAAEKMPKNVQDFKDHPYYALERHLRRNEVIHPKREVGKVSTGKAGSSSAKGLEAIYRRRDVYIVKSADSWYRLGREIKPNEQPIKRVQPRRRRDPNSDDDMFGDEENAGTAMYAAFQTIAYEAPPVVNSRIPKNAYGNLDIYVPSMVPKGGIHIPHPDASRAARLLGIDYADAVTGFEFKGRHGTAVVKGAVVATAYREAVEEVIQGYENERAEAEDTRRSVEALRMWKRFLAGLRIRERIEGYDIEGERDVVQEKSSYVNEDIEDDNEGGFFPDQDESAVAEPTAGRVHIEERNAGGGFFVTEPNDTTYGSTKDEFLELPATSACDNYSDIHGGEFFADEDDKDAEEALIGIHTDVQTKNNTEQSLRDGNTHTLYKVPSEDAHKHQEEGGGFVIDEPQDQAVHTSVDPLLPQDSLLNHDLTTDELSEARLLQQLYESTTQQPLFSTANVEESIAEVQTTGGDVQDRTEERGESVRSSSITPRESGGPVTEGGEGEGEEEEKEEEEGEEEEEAEEEDDDNNNNTEAGRIAEESDEDKESLLSHDPSDDDADPEWLV